MTDHLAAENARLRGPFTAGRCDVWSEHPEPHDGAAVFCADGQPFLLIADDLVVGGNALPRAKYVAEMLNATLTPQDHAATCTRCGSHVPSTLYGWCDACRAEAETPAGKDVGERARELLAAELGCPVESDTELDLRDKDRIFTSYALRAIEAALASAPMPAAVESSDHDGGGNEQEG